MDPAATPIARKRAPTTPAADRTLRLGRLSNGTGRGLVRRFSSLAGVMFRGERHHGSARQRRAAYRVAPGPRGVLHAPDYPAAAQFPSPRAVPVTGTGQPGARADAEGAMPLRAT